MKKIAGILCALFVALPARAADPAPLRFAGQAEQSPEKPRAKPDIAVALTDDLVEVDAGFAGARLTLFGAVTGVEYPARAVDIVAVIRGPAMRFEIRRLERKNLIWAPGHAHFVENAPGLYLTAASRPIDDVVPLPDQSAFHLGTDFLTFDISRPGDSGEPNLHDADFADAFINAIEDKDLYGARVGGVSFKKGALFAVNADLPANTPVGNYDVSVYLYQDGVLLGRDSATLIVNKVGIERRIYELAHQRPVSYGIVCVALSLFAGWIAAFAFRK